MGALEEYLKHILPKCLDCAKSAIEDYAKEMGSRFSDKDRFRKFLTEYSIQRIPGFRSNDFYRDVYSAKIDDFLSRSRHFRPSQCVEHFRAEFCNSLTNVPRDFTSFASKLPFISLPDRVPMHDQFAFRGFRILWLILRTDQRVRDVEEMKVVFFDQFQTLMNDCDNSINQLVTVQTKNDLILKLKTFDHLLMHLGLAYEYPRAAKNDRALTLSYPPSARR